MQQPARLLLHAVIGLAAGVPAGIAATVVLLPPALLSHVDGWLWPAALLGAATAAAGVLALRSGSFRTVGPEIAETPGSDEMRKLLDALRDLHRVRNASGARLRTGRLVTGE